LLDADGNERPDGVRNRLNTVRASPPEAIITLHRILPREVSAVNKSRSSKEATLVHAELTVLICRLKNCMKVERSADIHDEHGRECRDARSRTNGLSFFFAINLPLFYWRLHYGTIFGCEGSKDNGSTRLSCPRIVGESSFGKEMRVILFKNANTETSSLIK